jgi:hypothetical protein
MPINTRSGAHYRGNLPHFRSAGATYHVRFSVSDPNLRLAVSDSFQFTENALLFWHKKKCIVYCYTIVRGKLIHSRRAFPNIPRTGDPLHSHPDCPA